MRHRLVLVLAVAVAACDSGGSSNNVQNVPVLPWGSFRHDVSNSANGNLIQKNKGNVTFVALEGEPTTSTPAVDLNGNVYIGTSAGLEAYNHTKPPRRRWVFNTCYPPCAPNTVCPDPIPVGPVFSSPTLTAGTTIVFGSDPVPAGPNGVPPASPGALFAIQAQNNNDRAPWCRWTFPPADSTPPGYRVRSSVGTLVNPLDFSLQSVFFAGEDGSLRALNADGTARWSLPTGSVGLTSSPALDFSGNVYITTATGKLTVARGVGGQLWEVNTGVPPETQGLLPSPVIGTNAYVVGEDGSMFAFATDGNDRWQYIPENPIVGSLAVLLLSFDVNSFSTVDVIVHGIDREANVYAIRDSTGLPLVVQRCSEDFTRDCKTDSCAPNGGTCISNRCSLSGVMGCTADSCFNSHSGSCIVAPTYGVQPIAPPINSVPQTVSTSPVTTGDGFLVVGTDQGYVCATAVNGFKPDDDKWKDVSGVYGCIGVDPGNPVLSSPAIGPDGQIYVTTSSGLYIIQ